MKAGIPREWLAAQVQRCADRMGITLEELRARFANGELFADTCHQAYVARMYIDLLDAPEPQAEVTSADLPMASPPAEVPDASGAGESARPGGEADLPSVLRTDGSVGVSGGAD